MRASWAACMCRTRRGAVTPVCPMHGASACMQLRRGPRCTMPTRCAGGAVVPWGAALAGATVPGLRVPRNRLLSRGWGVQRDCSAHRAMPYLAGTPAGSPRTCSTPSWIPSTCTCNHGRLGVLRLHPQLGQPMPAAAIRPPMWHAGACRQAVRARHAAWLGSRQCENLRSLRYALPLCGTTAAGAAAPAKGRMQAPGEACTGLHRAGTVAMPPLTIVLIASGGKRANPAGKFAPVS